MNEVAVITWDWLAEHLEFAHDEKGSMFGFIPVGDIVELFREGERDAAKKKQWLYWPPGF